MLTTALEGNVVRLTGELDVYAVVELHQVFAQRLDALPLELGLADVDRVDGAGAQLLLWLQRQHQARGLTLGVRDVSDAVRAALTFLHFDGLR
ncbi:MAG: STAS domain-containing protein [Myxococcaceae bacterium]